MAENIAEITVEVENDGELVVEQLEKIVLTKGVWSTIIFRYRERDRKTNQFGPAKATLRRYQKSKGVYRKRDAVNLTLDSAKSLIDVLSGWIESGLLGAKDSYDDTSEEVALTESAPDAKAYAPEDSPSFAPVEGD